MNIRTEISIPITIRIDHTDRMLTVTGDQGLGRIKVPDSVHLDDVLRLEALAIIALTPVARKIIAHEQFFAEVVADEGVREFVELAHMTYGGDKWRR